MKIWNELNRLSMKSLFFAVFGDMSSSFTSYNFRSEDEKEDTIKTRTFIKVNWTYDNDFCARHNCENAAEKEKKNTQANRIFWSPYAYTQTNLHREVFSGLPMNKLLPIIKLQINGRVDIKQSVLQMNNNVCIAHYKLSNHTKPRLDVSFHSFKCAFVLFFF